MDRPLLNAADPLIQADHQPQPGQPQAADAVVAVVVQPPPAPPVAVVAQQPPAVAQNPIQQILANPPNLAQLLNAAVFPVATIRNSHMLPVAAVIGTGFIGGGALAKKFIAGTVLGINPILLGGIAGLAVAACVATSCYCPRLPGDLAHYFRNMWR